MTSVVNDIQTNDKISNRLFICNLHPSTSEGDLINIFQAFGKIAKIDYMWHKSGPNIGKPKGFAFLEYIHEESAIKAVKESNKIVARGRQITVRYRDTSVISGTSSLNGQRKRYRDSSMTALGSSGGDTKSIKNIRKMDEQMRRLQETLLQMEG